MDSPVVSTPLIQLRRRAHRPSWFQLGTITAWLAVGGFVAYAIAYSYAWSFLDRLGATPEEVGFTQPGLVIRLVVYGSTFVAVLGLSALLVASLPFFASRFLPSWRDLPPWIHVSARLQKYLRLREHRRARGWLVRRRR
jgi:hypothetical protein